MKLVRSSHVASARRNQERPGIRLIHRALRRARFACEPSALFSVGPLEQSVQEKIASQDAKGQKQCS